MIEFREYQDTDESAIIGLWCECFPEVPDAEAFRMALGRKRAMQPDPFVVAVQDGRVIGTAVGGMDGINAWVYFVAVRQEARRRGVGRRLLEAVEGRLRELGAQRVALQVFTGREDNVAFYQSLGYQIEPRISMAKRLESIRSNDVSEQVPATQNSACANTAESGARKIGGSK